MGCLGSSRGRLGSYWGLWEKTAMEIRRAAQPLKRLKMEFPAHSTEIPRSFQGNSKTYSTVIPRNSMRICNFHNLDISKLWISRIKQKSKNNLGYGLLILDGSNGIRWDSMECDGMRWNSMEFYGMAFHRIPSNSIEFHRLFLRWFGYVC